MNNPEVVNNNDCKANSLYHNIFLILMIILEPYCYREIFLIDDIVSHILEYGFIIYMELIVLTNNLLRSKLLVVNI